MFDVMGYLFWSGMERSTVFYLTFEATTLLAKCPSKYDTGEVNRSPIRGVKGDVL
ncbi:MAG: cytochrome c maturation protein CcmE [Deltaproteobacteria bacterium]|nr:cytochrome c maturation protein CcmE [Deltaproteobacteria bacterium]